MKKSYVYSGELHDENEHGHLCEVECCHPVYFVPEVDARIAELEKRIAELTTCECGLPLTRGICTGHCDNDE